jgi:uncharacterized membrane protein YeaQ/YmgE (transglycosylase-associated protein family)
MYLFAWVVIGAVVGWGAGRALDGYGPLMDTLLGIGGGIVGGFLARVEGFDGDGGAIVTSLVAMVGAALLTMLAAYLNGRRSLRPSAVKNRVRRFGLATRSLMS